MPFELPHEVGSVADWVSGIGSVFALVAAVWAIRKQAEELGLQRDELKLQRTELELQRGELKRSSDAQERLGQLEASRLEAETNRDLIVVRPLLVDLPIWRELEPFSGSVTFADNSAITRRVDGSVFVQGGQGETARLHLYVRNIGSGTAFLVGVDLSVDHASCPGVIGQAVLSPGEFAGLTFTVLASRPEQSPVLEAIQSRSSSLRVEVAYTNVAGGDRLRSVFHLAEDERQMRVRQVTIAEADTRTRIVQSGPSGA